VVITAFIKIHAIFTQKFQESYFPTLVELSTHLDSHIGCVTQKYLEQGYYIAISNCLALLGFRLPDAILVKALTGSNASESTDADMSGTPAAEATTDSLLFEGA
jgi:hypothetical protein